MCTVEHIISKRLALKIIREVITTPMLRHKIDYTVAASDEICIHDRSTLHGVEEKGKIRQNNGPHIMAENRVAVCFMWCIDKTPLDSIILIYTESQAIRVINKCLVFVALNI